MATQIIAEKPSAVPALELEALGKLALELLDEIDEQVGHLYAVAAGGLAYIDRDNQPIERSLFLVIQSVSADGKLSSTLRSVISQMMAREVR